MNIGNKLRSIREIKGFTIYKLSKEMGISQNHIGGIELGKDSQHSIPYQVCLLHSECLCLNFSMKKQKCSI